MFCILGNLSVIQTNKMSRQDITEKSSESNDAKETTETAFKYLPVSNINFTGYIFYLLSIEKFSHFHQHPSTIDWVETFSPPPELA